MTISQILAWADEWFARTGAWPKLNSGVIPGSANDTWRKVDAALRAGTRGLAGGSTLCRLLAEKRGVRNQLALPALSEEQILACADKWFARTGAWPMKHSGEIRDCPGETWAKVHEALRAGTRGLAGGSSLAQLLADKRGVRNRANLPPLNEDQILAWADDHFRRTGRWPDERSGAIPGTPGESWKIVNFVLEKGGRGLPGASSLTRLLQHRRGVRNRMDLPRFTEEQILAWADDHFRRTGTWPSPTSGPIAAAPEETWNAVASALAHGKRGLPGGSSIACLFQEHRGVRHRGRPPDLSEEQVLSWADAHHRTTGGWPHVRSGRIADAGGETWSTVDQALHWGQRGLPESGSLSQFLRRKRGVRPGRRLPALTEEQILAWTESHFRRTGRWPSSYSGVIADAPEMTWSGVSQALYYGLRGLPGGSSLARLLFKKLSVCAGRKPPLAETQILAWADAHQRAKGEWPTPRSGPIAEAPGETWRRVDWALREGMRGLTGGSSLARLRRERQGGPRTR